MKRQPGFYWVKYGCEPWAVAEWFVRGDGVGGWCFVSNESFFTSDDNLEIDDRRLERQE